jgi:hypothetical protein
MVVGLDEKDTEDVEEDDADDDVLIGDKTNEVVREGTGKPYTGDTICKGVKESGPGLFTE